MPELPFIYVCSHAGKIGNIRWVNSDTRWPDWIHKRWVGSAMRKGYWGRCGLANSPGSPDSSPPLP
jgi:hypothetical protein